MAGVLVKVKVTSCGGKDHMGDHLSATLPLLLTQVSLGSASYGTHMNWALHSQNRPRDKDDTRHTAGRLVWPALTGAVSKLSRSILTGISGNRGYASCPVEEERWAHVVWNQLVSGRTQRGTSEPSNARGCKCL